MFNKILIFVSLWLRIFFPSHLLQDFYLWFSVVENDMHRCNLFVYCIYLAWVLRASWICGLVSDFNLLKLSALLSQIFLLFFFLLLLVFPLHICYTFCNCPTVVGWSVLFSLSLCSLCFSVFEDSIDISLAQKILSSTMSSLLISPSKAFFVFVLMLVITNISFLVVS